MSDSVAGVRYFATRVRAVAYARSFTTPRRAVLHDLQTGQYLVTSITLAERMEATSGKRSGYEIVWRSDGAQRRRQMVGRTASRTARRSGRR